jgi:hypothetical protein
LYTIVYRGGLAGLVEFFSRGPLNKEKYKEQLEPFSTNLGNADLKKKVMMVGDPRALRASKLEEPRGKNLTSLYGQSAPD